MLLTKIKWRYPCQDLTFLSCLSPSVQSQPPVPSVTVALLRGSPLWFPFSLCGLVLSDAIQPNSIASHPQSGDAQMCTSSQAPSLSSGCGYRIITLMSLPRWPRNCQINISMKAASPTPANQCSLSPWMSAPPTHLCEAQPSSHHVLCPLPLHTQPSPTIVTYLQ